MRKKFFVQKSIRIDAQLSEDLETLSTTLNRPQSELINFAIENLIQENKEWFSRYFFESALKDVLDCKKKNMEYSIDGITVTLTNLDAGWHLKWVAEHAGDDGEFEGEFGEEQYSELREALAEAGTYLDNDLEEVKEFLIKRLNYK